MRKGENADNQHFFPFSRNIFFPIKDKNHQFNTVYFVVCKCFEFVPVKKLVVWQQVHIIRFINRSPDIACKDTVRRMQIPPQ